MVTLRNVVEDVVNTPFEAGKITFGSQNDLINTSAQIEFCPPLDSSLLAALLADIEADELGNDVVPSLRQVEDLKSTLRELSSQADESQLSEFSDLHLISNTEDTSSTPDFYRGNTATSSSDTSESSQQSFSSPLGFLQAALPHIPTETLRLAIEGTNSEDVEMWDIVADILTADFIREMEERGLNGLDEEGLNGIETLREKNISWETVEHKKKSMKVVKRKPARGQTISLADVRQRQHAPKHRSTDASRPVAAPDPWTQLSSLSTHLATLLPPHPSSFFQSFFHSPNHATPYSALRACLKSINSSQSDAPSDEYMDTFSTLLDIILPEYETLDHGARMRLISDVEVSLQATFGRGGDALDVAKLLRELDSDSTGSLDMGVYHVAPQSPQTEGRHSNPHTSPPSIPLPPQLRPKEKPPPSSTKSSPYQWQKVPERRLPNQGPHPLAAHIPSYANIGKVKGAGNAYGKGGKGDVGELIDHRRRMGENLRKRDELLKQATRMWQRRNSKTRGGEIAFYFAERAREFQEAARVESLNAARSFVESKRAASGDPYTADLHGTTASEAISIVKEILQTLPTSPGKPLKVITGRGSHSVNQVSVLKPAIKKTLVEDNWSVGSWDGGLVVRGKR
ncbi:hypothetical protein H0H87_004409 [Tephrocybe sp. NHM501043]|nr:hypothetical protein H0H87_004409 [Tephrocybe sp. NHM501043]